jgi:lipid-A-disaccharide synthase-like uncharacterized protein
MYPILFWFLCIFGLIMFLIFFVKEYMLLCI